MLKIEFPMIKERLTKRLELAVMGAGCGGFSVAE
jgi:hypothetical protein